MNKECQSCTYAIVIRKKYLFVISPLSRLRLIAPSGFDPQFNNEQIGFHGNGGE
jgi:hypothetical protein